jgi:hypothetical protein
MYFHYFLKNFINKKKTILGVGHGEVKKTHFSQLGYQLFQLLLDLADQKSLS